MSIETPNHLNPFEKNDFEFEPTPSMEKQEEKKPEGSPEYWKERVRSAIEKKRDPVGEYAEAALSEFSAKQATRAAEMDSFDLTAEASNEQKKIEGVQAQLSLIAANRAHDEEKIAALLALGEHASSDARAELERLYNDREGVLNQAIKKNEQYITLLKSAIGSTVLRAKFGEAFSKSYENDLHLAEAEGLKLKNLLAVPRVRFSVVTTESSVPRVNKGFFGRFGGFMKGLFGKKPAQEKISPAQKAENLERNYQLAADVNMQLDSAIESYSVAGVKNEIDAFREALQLHEQLAGKTKEQTRLFYAKVLAGKVRELKQDSRSAMKAHMLKEIVKALDAETGGRL